MGTKYLVGRSTDVLTLEAGDNVTMTKTGTNLVVAAEADASTLAPHHTTHEPGGTDALVNAAWTDVANTFTEDQVIDGDLFVTGTITPLTDAQRDSINALVGDPTGARTLMSEDFSSGLSMRHERAAGHGRIAVGNYDTQTYQPLLFEVESLQVHSGVSPAAREEHVRVHPSGGVTVGAGTDHATDPGVGIVKARGLDGTPLNASQLQSGTVPDARLSGNVVLTTDPRLTNARTPTAHAATHQPGGSDPLQNVAWTNQTNVFAANQIMAVSNPSLVLDDAAQPANARKFIFANSGQRLRFYTTGDDYSTQVLVLDLLRNGDAILNRDLYEKGRAVAMGVPTAFTPQPYGNTAISTIGTADYSIVGYTMTVGMYLSDTYLTVAQNALQYYLPNSAIARGYSHGSAFCVIGGTWEVCVAVAGGPGNPVFSVHRNGLATFPASTTFALHVTLPVFIQ